jgi:hypothetical protein
MEPVGYGLKMRKKEGKLKICKQASKQTSKTFIVVFSSPLRSSALLSPLPSYIDLGKFVKT